jgi:hypothetical protein
MKHHSEALSIYKNFSGMIRTHFDTSLLVFHADSTGEYLSDALHQVLPEEDPLAQFSCPGVHAQNGVAKHKHCHLLETARALMIAFSGPPHFWTEVVSTATYLINIQPSSAIQGGIPFERLCGKMPDYSNHHLFVCVCYMLLAPHEHTKLTAQSVECVFLGYSTEHMGYLRSLVGYERHGMLSLTSHVLSIRILPLMLPLHLWLTLYLSYFF